MISEYKTLETIGVIHSPFKEKFGLPRQASLIKSCTAEIELIKPFNNPDFVKGLEDFTDIWLIFGFHKHEQSTVKPLVRPPRLGGNKKVGVFASRSPFRPNGLGISRVELIEIKNINNSVRVVISCPDMVDGTPVYDIKPYIHYSDSNQQAVCGFAQDEPKNNLNVEFSDESINDLSKLNSDTYPNLKHTISELLAQNPCPAYIDDLKSKIYGVKLYDLNVVWEQSNDLAIVQSIKSFS